MLIITKKEIAREIIIFFGSLLLIVLAWVYLYTVNKIYSNKRDNIKKQIIYSNHKIDSLQATFPQSKTFKEVIIDKNAPFNPDIYLAEKSWGKYRLPLPEEILGTNLDEITSSNLRKLYKLLEILEYPKDIDYLNADGLPVFKNIKRIIPAELKKSSQEMKELQSIHQFLKDKKFMKASFNEFIFTLQGLPLPPPHNKWEEYNKQKDSINNLNAELRKVNSKIRPNNNIQFTIKWLGIIIFSLIYPLRLVILLLFWAIRTLKN